MNKYPEAQIEQDFRQNPQQEVFEYRLAKAFELETLENGLTHSAEQIIEQALQSDDREDTLRQINSLVLNPDNRDFGALILRCLSRLRPGTAQWRKEIVQTALTANELELRDAAVLAAESWGEQTMRLLLENHQESMPWLDDYIEMVIKELND